MSRIQKGNATTIAAGRMDEATRPSGVQLGRHAAVLVGWGRPVDRCSPFWEAAGGVDVGSIGGSVEVWTLHTEAGCDVGTQREILRCEAEKNL